MRMCIASLLILASFAWAAVQVAVPPDNTAWGYIQKYGIRRAEEIREAEENLINSRIVGGVPAATDQYPFMAGLIGDIIGLDDRSVCGASLISPSRAVTAAHCWFDGVNQIWRLTVVLGSTALFTGGTRVESSVVAVHPNWSALLARNDVAVIYLPSPVMVSENIAPVALPNALASELFVGESAIAVGFGLIADGGGIGPDQSLNHVRLNVITNSVCSYAFPFIIQPTHICTRGVGGVSVCRGDSGGPLVDIRDGKPVLIGIASFVSVLGCESNLPAAFSRVTSFLDFIGSHI